MTRKILTGVFAIVAVFALVATASAQTSYNFTQNLTIGSTGSEVVALQTALVSMGHLTMPAGVSMGYFGALTQSALAKYQASKGITPAVGYFGPITRASFAANTTPTVPPMNPCTSIPGTVPAMYGNMIYCVPGTPGQVPPSTSSTEGTLDVRLSPTPANNANIQTSVDVPVYGIELKAKIADVTVDRVDLQVGVTETGTSENPASLINVIKVWDGSTTLKTWSVTSADFIKSGSTYYVRLSGLGFVVPKDTTKVLTFSFTTNGGIDVERVVTVNGYGANSLRAVSGANVTSYYDISASTRTHTFKEPGESTLTLSADANNIDAMNHEVDTDNGSEDVIMQTFNVKSETGDSVVTDVTAMSTTTDSTSLSTLYLYDGSTLVDSQAWVSNSGYIVFSDLEINVPKGVTKTLTLKADFGTNTGSSTVASTSVLAVRYDRPNDSSAVASSTIRGTNQYFYPAVPNFTFVSSSVSATTLGNATNTTKITGNFVFRVRPEGGSMTGFAAAGTDFVVSTTTTGNNPAGATKSVTVIPNDSTYAEGGDYTVNLAFDIPNSGINTSGLYTFYVNSITWTVGSTGPITQTWGLDDFKTSAVSFSR